MRVWVVCTRTRTRLPDGHMMLPNYVPAGRNIISYPSPYRVKPVGYSGFGYPLPSLGRTAAGEEESVTKRVYVCYLKKKGVYVCLLRSLSSTYVYACTIDTVLEQDVEEGRRRSTFCLFLPRASHHRVCLAAEDPVDARG
jgi:hypothetical protein